MRTSSRGRAAGRGDRSADRFRSARELEINEGTLGNWCVIVRRVRDGDDRQLSESERAELVQSMGR
jgi:hypothetical protein